MSLSATLFGRDSAIHRATNIMGLGIPGWLDRKFGVQDAQGPALGEMAQQTSQEGVARPIVFGVVRPIAGNLIAVQDPPVIRKIKQKQEGGKGGGSKSKTTYVDAAFRTYAIRICEGPVTGVRRVWRNNKLVYDGRTGSAWGAQNNGTFLAKAKFYLGGWTQMPAPELQAIFGMGNVPAHRGTCYMTMNDEDLTEMGGAVPQFIFEVERAEGSYLTSRPYAVENLESSGVSSFLVKPPLEFVDSAEVSNTSVVTGSLRNPVINLSNGTESSEQVSCIAVSGDLTEVLPPEPDFYEYLESSENSACMPISGNLNSPLISYNNGTETVGVENITVVGGSL